MSHLINSIQGQYQEFPYPARDPAEEKGVLRIIFGENLGELNHWLYQGKESFRNGFRALIAGGGTGDSTIFLAHQLKETDAEIVYLDFSQSSMEIAKERARIKGLTNITWICDDLFHLPALVLGKFDYINCSGVLHHLASPLQGLSLLADSLTEKGGMLIMIYGKYGRTGVYLVQEMLRRINEGALTREEEICNGRKALAELSKSHWFNCSPEEILGEALHDTGFYDLCLHKQDRAFSIPELHLLVEEAGLRFVEFIDSKKRFFLNPRHAIKDRGLQELIQNMDRLRQQAVMELFHGDLFRHEFYASRQKSCIASFEDLDNVPYFFTISPVARQVWEFLDANPSYLSSKSVALTISHRSLKEHKIYLPISPYTKKIFEQLSDGSKCLRQIYNALQAEFAESDAILQAAVKEALDPFYEMGMVLLRDRSVAPFAIY